VYEEAAEVFGIFFDPMVEIFDVFLLEKFKDAFFEDAGSLSGDDFDEGDFFVNGLVDDVVERGFDLAAAVEDVVKIKFELGHGRIVME
jgi:hypothetical protein